MTIPEHGYPRAAAVSPRVQVVPTTDSTNADVVAGVVADPAAWPHLSLLVTRDQRAGKGRLDRSWTAPPGTALAVSVVVRVPGIPPVARGWIPLIAGAAMARAIGEQLIATGHSVAVKWPNDVLMDGAKVCGILAETVPGHPDTVVIGAGVNTTMSRTDLPVAHATSFAAAGLECDDDRLLADYLTTLDEQLAALAAARGDAAAAGVQADVSKNCSTIGTRVKVSLPGGAILEGRARRLDETGRLVIEEQGVEAVVSAGDVIHLR